LTRANAFSTPVPQHLFIGTWKRFSSWAAQTDAAQQDNARAKLGPALPSPAVGARFVPPWLPFDQRIVTSAKALHSTLGRRYDGNPQQEPELNLKAERRQDMVGHLHGPGTRG